ncbi:hypothetical protein JCM10213v2_006275 [Rhodosporidiobolus nylandii]
MESELAQVVHAIQSLYSPSTPPSVQSTLQSQLQAVQLSPLAWGLVGPLIGHDDPSVRFFAAQTLQTKIGRGWESLPVSAPAAEEGELPAEVEQLKQSVLSWLAASAAAAYPAGQQPGRSGEKPVLRKLAAAATALSLRLEDRWKDWLLEAVMRVAASGAGREGTLEVLSVAIEEVARAELVGSKREITSALTCFVSYLNAGQLSHGDLTTLYPLFLPHLTSPATCIAACGAVEELIERSSAYGTSGGVTRFMNRQRTEELVAGWGGSAFVQGVVASAVAEAQEGSEPDDEAMAVFKLLATLSEHFISSFVFDAPPSSSPVPVLSLTSPATHTLLRTLLALSTFPGHSPESYAVNELAGGSWMALQEMGSDEGLVAGPGDGREGREGREGEWEVYRGVFEALAMGLRERARRPNEGEVRGWPKDIRDAFRVYRSTVLADTLQYCFYVLRDSLIGTLVSLASQQIATAPPPGTTDAHEDLEATLFALYALGEVVPLSPSLSDALSSEDAAPSPLTTYLQHLFSPSVLGALPSTPGTFPNLRSTALRLVGAYAPWFSAHPQECLGAITFVVSALSSREAELIPGAARALKGLCDANRKVLTGHVGSFVQVLGGLEGSIEDGELAKVLESVASVVQALPGTDAVEPLLTLANPVVAKLQQAVSGASSDPEPARLLCLQQLLYLSALSRGLSDPDGDLIDLDASLDDSSVARLAALRVLEEPRVVQMREELGKAVEGAARVWAGDTEVVTALSDYIRRSTSDSLPSPLALPSLALLSLASSALQSAPSSVWLGIMSQLLARLARDKTDGEMSDEEMGQLGRPVEAALNVVLSTHGDLQSMGENPDVVAAFLSFCSQIIKHYPRIFSALPTHYLDAVLAFAERGLGMQEQFSLKSTIEVQLSAVQQTAFPTPSSRTFSTVLSTRLPSLLRALLLAIGGGVPRSHLTQLSELLHACLLRLGEPARQGLRGLLGEDGFPSERAGGEQKSKFERAVLAARTGKQVRQAVSDFALVCRGLDGSAYGAATGGGGGF